MSDSTTLAAQARQWSVDAQDAVDSWVNGATYTTTKDATLKEELRRLGVLMSNIAEHLDRYGFPQ